MTIEKRKESIKQHMGYLIKARDYLLDYNKDELAQLFIKSGRGRFGARFNIEIESPQVGGTDADWIRLCYDDVYLFLHDDGTEWYQLDPLAEYGDEIIDVKSEKEFFEELDKLGDIEEYYNW